MMKRMLGRWGALEGFDKVGLVLLGWELSTLGATLVVLPLAREGQASVGLCILLAANLVGLGTAVVAWLLTHVGAPPATAALPQETVRNYIEREVSTFRARQADAREKRLSA